MKVIAFASQKGGVSKTTLAIHMACELMRSGAAVALLDLDTQASVVKWRKRRESDQPEVVASDLQKLPRHLEAFRRAGVAFAVLDLPGRASGVVNVGMKAAHLIIIPAAPVDIDVEAALETVEAARRLKKRFVFVLTNAPAQVARTQHFASLMQQRGLPALAAFIGRRHDFSDAISEGMGVFEYAPRSIAAVEIAMFTAEVLELLK